MNMYDIIYKKREGGTLKQEEIDFFIRGMCSGDIPDYQVSALLMAMFLKGMSKEETVLLTDAMKRSGDIMDLSAIKGIKADKHSTGGVGDKTTLIAAPIAAACGVPVAKMSGRGLGFTGGTIDKLESIPGFRTAMDVSEFSEQVNRIGIAIAGQTARIAPADKKLYAIRDVTATVDHFSLIASSVMSKKLASGSDAIVLDVKVGGGAFMKREEDASDLAELMVEIGNTAGKRTAALLTAMDEPLGYAVGNSLEVEEAVAALKGKGPKDLTELCIWLSGYMICFGGKADSPEQGREKAKQALLSGAALEKFRELVTAQGGDPGIIECPSRLPQPGYKAELRASQSGYITEIAAETIGFASQHAGAGRTRKEDSIDPAAGILLRKKTGDFINQGDVLASVFAENKELAEKSAKEAQQAFKLGKTPPEPQNLIKKVIE